MHTVARAAEPFVPPVLFDGMRRCARALLRPRPRLFDGDGETFAELVAGASVYGEYGVGMSTQYVHAHTKAKIRSVDTSQVWIDSVLADKEPGDRIRISHVDVGPLGEWGRPTGYSKRKNFHSYVESIWQYGDKPDFVLVDGRFRVSCFLYSLAHANPGTVIVFDDYRDRPHYHLVEEYLIPERRSGRQAIFRVPEGIDREQVLAESAKFAYVIE